MTRNDAIASINATLTSLDDQRVLTVADIVAEMAGGNETYPLRELTPREQALIKQSKDDFAAGRTRSVQESEAYVAAELDRRLAARVRV
jgi:hypothetical protein